MNRPVVMMAMLVMNAAAWAMEPVTAAGTPASSVPPRNEAAQAPAREPVKAAAADASLNPAVDTSGPVALPAAKDRIDLEATQITGNRELPRVLYVVPWKRSDLGDLAGKPANSLLDEVLAPVDRDVFRRQNRYYQALKPDSSGTGKAGGAEGEK